MFRLTPPRSSLTRSNPSRPTRSLRISKLAAIAAAGLTFTLAAPVAVPTGLGVISAAQAQEPSRFKSILSSYGAFQAHDKYGEIWIPARSTVPEGWHPYPSCHWVYHKDLGWFFDDKTEWGKIVHHYGRWAHDKDLGWVWLKGEEFSPGWVVWRTSDKWVGWAPMPPEQDLKEISAAEFNSDKHWTFMDAKVFGAKCAGGGDVLVSNPPATIFQQTRLVTEVKFVSGIAVFVLPPPLIINIVDIDIGIFPPWSPCFFGAWFWNWNTLINNVVINININGPHCKPNKNAAPPLIPIRSTPPPAPGSKPTGPSGKIPDRRVDLPSPPSFVPPASRPPIITPDRPRLPPVVQRPDRPKLPPIVRVPNGPRKPPVVIKPDLPTKPPQVTIPHRKPVPRLVDRVKIPQQSASSGPKIYQPPRPVVRTPSAPIPKAVVDLPRRSQPNR